MSTGSIELETQLIERIVERRNEILARAKKKAQTILSTAEEEVDKIKAESERQVLELVDSELRAVRDRIVGRTELEGRKAVMSAKQELVTRVFEETKRRLSEITERKGAEYGEILVKFIVEAVAAIGGDAFIVAANERDIDYLRTNLRKINNQVKKTVDGGNVRLSDRHLDILGGVVVKNADDTKTYHNTLEGRLAKARSSKEAEVAKILGVI